MSLENSTLIGRIAVYRPLLVTLVMATGAAALTAHATTNVAQFFHPSSLVMLVAILCLVSLPVVLGAMAPRKRVLRALFASGIVICALATIYGFDYFILDKDYTSWIITSALAALFLVLFGFLWAGGPGCSVVAVMALPLGCAITFASLAELNVQGAFEMRFVLAAMAMAPAVVIAIAAAFAKNFVEGHSGLVSAAQATRAAFTVAVFIAVSLTCFAAASALLQGEVISSAVLAAIFAALSCAIPAVMIGGGALGLRKFSEQLAVNENRRQFLFGEALKPLRNVFPASSALAASAIIIVFSIVSAFESPTALSGLEIIATFVAAMIAGITFVSLRTAFLTFILMGTSALTQVWIYSSFGAVLPDEGSRALALVIGSISIVGLCVAWRDVRHPMRKAREVTTLALVDGVPMAVVTAFLSACVLVGAHHAGFFQDALPVVYYMGAIVVTSILFAIPVMTATGALFGRT